MEFRKDTYEGCSLRIVGASCKVDLEYERHQGDIIAFLQEVDREDGDLGWKARELLHAIGYYKLKLELHNRNVLVAKNPNIQAQEAIEAAKDHGID